MTHSFPTRRSSDVEVVKAVAGEMGKAPSQVALAWTLLNAAVAAPIMGVRTMEQFEDNLGALDVVLSEDQRGRLESASTESLGFPHDFLALTMTRDVMFRSEEHTSELQSLMRSSYAV